MIFKNFSKDNILPLLRKYGFDGIDDAAFIKIVLTIEVLVYNLLNNVLHVVNALNLKVLRKEHFEAVMAIMNDYAKSGVMKGGHAGTVLPSEYFNIDSGRYFTDVSQYEQTAFSDTLTRNAIDIKMPIMSAGAAAAANEFISAKEIKTLIDKFKLEKKLTFKVSKTAYDIIIQCVIANITELLKACKEINQKKAKANLGSTLIFSALNKNPKKFAHLSYVWKN